jgi:tRNA threonylcarbamoyl adenosine modification protein YeaZ
LVTPVLPENRYGLAIHTASADLGLAIRRLSSGAEPGQQGEERCQTWAIGREVSRYLHLYLNEFLAPQTWADLALIAVAKGPGGFTGTRLGVVTARTLAQQLNLPLFAISTLAAVAWTEREPNSGSNSQINPPINPPTNSEAAAPSVDIAVQMPAQRGELYVAIYGCPPDQSKTNQPETTQFTALRPDAVMNLQQWQTVLTNWPTPYRLVQAEANLGSTAAGLLELASLDWQQGPRPHWSAAIPFYGQSPV